MVSHRRTRGGFTLIELMVVVAIVAIVAAIGVPNLLQARKLTNETSAISTLRTIHTAETLFKDRDHDKNGKHDYAVANDFLAGLMPMEVFKAFEQGRPFSGYAFGLLSDAPPDPNTFGAIAMPWRMGYSGDRTYFIDETGVVRYSTAFWVEPSMIDDSFEPPPMSFFKAWPPIGAAEGGNGGGGSSGGTSGGSGGSSGGSSSTSSSTSSSSASS